MGNTYSKFIDGLYEILSADFGDKFIGIDEVLEEMPPSADYIIRPSFTFGSSSTYTNIRTLEDDVIINLQLFKAHNSNEDIVEKAEKIRDELKDVKSFIFENWKLGISTINLVKNFDAKYQSVTVQIFASKLEQIEEDAIDWTTRPLTFVAAEPNTKIIIRRYGDAALAAFQYKFNIDDDWQNYTRDSVINLEKAGDMVMFQNGRNQFCINTGNYFNVEVTGSIYARGKIESLTNYQAPYNYSFYKLFEGCEGLLSTPLFPSSTVVSHVYDSTFKGCSNLIEAEDLEASGQINDSQYYNMFLDCTKLTKAPKIKLKSVASSTCWGMFKNCVSLTEAPELIPSAVSAHSYREMFKGCANLTHAPELPATTLGGNCYYEMFVDCINLIKAPELPATTLSSYCYQGMFKGCKKLKKSPQLNFTNAPSYACQYMFQNCDALEEGPSALLADVVEVGAYDAMFNSCQNLIKAPIIHASSVGQYGFRGMFYNCLSLTEAQDVLSANMTGTGAYQNMFYLCTKLTKAPDLPMTSLESTCYQNMFRECRSLTESPILPAITLPATAYQNMFLNCVKLEKAGEIKATTLNTSSMNAMFQGCTALSDVTVNFTAWSPANATASWFASVPQEVGRVFRCPSSLPNTRGINNIPVNWSKVDI